jgi:hypothetical protein
LLQSQTWQAKENTTYTGLCGYWPFLLLHGMRLSAAKVNIVNRMQTKTALDRALSLLHFSSDFNIAPNDPIAASGKERYL